MRTLITAAGDSRSLFLGSGFAVPKSLVPVNGRPVILRAIESYAQDLRTTTVAINKIESEDWGLSTFLHSELPEIEIVKVPSNVKGALVTALWATESCEEESEILIAAGDSEISIRLDNILHQFRDQSLHAGTVVFKSTNPRLSYILPGPDGSIRQVAEKRLIGPLATTGIFYFKSCALFRRAAEWCLVNDASLNGIFFVSTALNFLIAEGLRVKYVEIPQDSYKSWSLPADFASLSF